MMKKKYTLAFIFILLSCCLHAQDTSVVSMDSMELPMLSQLHYEENSSISNRDYAYDIYNRARFYKSMGYTVMIAGPLIISAAFTCTGYALSETFDMPTWGEIVVPLAGMAIGAGISVPIILVGINMVRKGNMIEQTAYMPITDKVSLSTSHYANINDRRDQGTTFGLAVKL